jgi:aromatic ring-opening dioxygenase catalytic subunit (LigB family)
MLPVLFLSHGGGPAHALDSTGSSFQSIDINSPSAAFMRSLPSILESNLPSNTKPECFLVISAHWEEPNFTVDYQTKATKLVYDYYGFPEEAYAPHLTYPVKTNLKVADRVLDLLSKHGITAVKKDRGFDHGVFMPLRTAFPEANIPVVQLSLRDGLSMTEHIRIGELLRPLRSEGVVIVASGQITHNLREIRSPRNDVDPRTVEFLEFMHELMTKTTSETYEQSKEILINIADHAPNFYWAHPRPEHFLPLAVSFGASYIPHEGGETSKPFVQRLYSEIVMGSMGIDSYIWL